MEKRKTAGFSVHSHLLSLDTSVWQTEFPLLRELQWLPQQQFLIARGGESLKTDRVMYPQSPTFIKPAMENFYDPTWAPEHFTGTSVFSFRIALSPSWVSKCFHLSTKTREGINHSCNALATSCQSEIHVCEWSDGLKPQACKTNPQTSVPSVEAGLIPANPGLLRLYFSNRTQNVFQMDF